MSLAIYSTVDLPEDQQLAAWRGWFDSVFEIQAGPSQTGFAARSELRILDGLALGRVQAPHLTATRSAALIRRNPIDHWIITVGRQRTRGSAGKEIALDVPAGTPFVVSLGRKIVSTRNDDTRLHLYLSRDAFSDLAPALDALEGLPLDRPLGRLLGDYIGLLASHLGDIGQDEFPRLRSAVRAMVGACLSVSAEGSAAGALQIDLTRREKIRNLVIAHLGNPALSPEFLCQTAGMSRTRLYHHLQEFGGVSRYIQRMRLIRIYNTLSDPANTRSISSIAADMCFPDASTFSRLFKQEFSMTPSDIRNSARAGSPVARPSDVMAGHDGALLRDLLRRL